MATKFTNNATTNIVGGLAVDGTTLTVTTGHGVKFPAITGADIAYIGIWDGQGRWEICSITAHTAAADTMTIERGQDGTTALVWAADDLVELILAAAWLNGFTIHTHTPYAAIDHAHEGDYLNIIGDTMTGGLNLIAPSVGDSSTQAVTTAWVNTNYQTFDIPSGYPGSVLANTTVLSFQTTKEYTLPSGLTGSQFYVGINAATTLTINKNGSSIGTVTFNGVGNTPSSITFTTQQSFIFGDRLTIVNSLGAAIEDLYITLVATRTL